MILMLDPLQIVKTTAQPAAVIHFTIPRDQIRDVMGPAIMEVMAAASAQSIGPAGPVFTHHFEMKPDVFNFEVGVPVTSPVKPVGRVFGSEIPAATVARTVYTGPYEGLGDAWGEFMDQIEAAGHKEADNLWECYITGPESSPDSATWRTELNRPLIN
jgi:effector-binding domain-containing protein